MCPETLDQILVTSFSGCGRTVEVRRLNFYGNAQSMLLLKGVSMAKQLIFNKIRQLASIWCKQVIFLKGST